MIIFFQAEDGIRDLTVTGVQTCALPISPSVTGQARVISEALSVARVDPGSVQYLETHGSGTPLGDAIELKAVGEVLSEAELGRASCREDSGTWSAFTAPRG